MNRKSGEKLLMSIKMKGEATLVALSAELGMTREGVRQHLLKLLNEGLITSVNKSERVGRPTAYYSLTDKGLSKFPDTHAQITVDLLKSVKTLLGDNALDLLISDREKQTYARYEKELSKEKTINKKLEILANLRTVEGYMAEWSNDGEVYYFIENHCPICAAATECQGFCRAELKNFRQLLGPEYEVDRIQHIVTEGNRCVYRVEESQTIF